MRRWRDQSNTGCRVARTGDPVINLMAGQLPAFARFGALGHFYLQLIGIGQVVRSNAETRRSDLFNCRPHGIAVRYRFISYFIFASLAGVAFTANAVHGNGYGAMRLVRYGTE